MKKLTFAVALLMAGSTAVFAQDNHNHADHAAAPAPQDANKPTAEQVMKFKADTYDFGTIKEGPAADHEFEFKNVGKEPILVNNAAASCGCTTPSWTKDPILPGKTGKVKASYNTQGRPGPFTKTITIMTNFGNKVVTIKGNVEKAPDNSVPQNSNMMKVAN